MQFNISVLRQMNLRESKTRTILWLIGDGLRLTACNIAMIKASIGTGYIGILVEYLVGVAHCNGLILLGRCDIITLICGQSYSNCNINHGESLGQIIL